MNHFLSFFRLCVQFWAYQFSFFSGLQIATIFFWERVMRRKHKKNNFFSDLSFRESDSAPTHSSNFSNAYTEFDQDSKIITQLNQLFTEESLGHENQICYSVSNGMVYLSGKVQTVAKKKKILDQVKRIPGVKSLDDDLFVLKMKSEKTKGPEFVKRRDLGLQV